MPQVLSRLDQINLKDAKKNKDKDKKNDHQEKNNDKENVGEPNGNPGAEPAEPTTEPTQPKRRRIIQTNVTRVDPQGQSEAPETHDTAKDEGKKVGEDAASKVTSKTNRGSRRLRKAKRVLKAHKNNPPVVSETLKTLSSNLEIRKVFRFQVCFICLNLVRM